MSKVRVDQLSPTDDSVIVNVADLANLIAPAQDYTGQNTRQQIRSREAALSSNTIRFCTWNTQGDVSVGYYGGDFASRERSADLTDYYLRIGADFIGHQEEMTVPNKRAKDFCMYPYIDGFFGVCPGVRETRGRKWGDLVISTRQLNNSTSTQHSSTPDGTDSEIREYIRTEITIGTHTVVIYNTHMSTSSARRAVDFAALAASASAETTPFVVLMGDWNADADAEYAPLVNAGFTMLNHYGDVNTCNNGGTWYLDRILYRGFSSHGEYGAFDNPTSLGDHKAFYADLIM